MITWIFLHTDTHDDDDDDDDDNLVFSLTFQTAFGAEPLAPI